MVDTDYYTRNWSRREPYNTVEFNVNGRSTSYPLDTNELIQYEILIQIKAFNKTKTHWKEEEVDSNVNVKKWTFENANRNYWPAVLTLPVDCFVFFSFAFNLCGCGYTCLIANAFHVIRICMLQIHRSNMMDMIVKWCKKAWRNHGQMGKKLKEYGTFCVNKHIAAYSECIANQFKSMQQFKD